MAGPVDFDPSDRVNGEAAGGDLDWEQDENESAKLGGKPGRKMLPDRSLSGLFLFPKP
ncbi:MAG TPA: hypothetical protein VFQ52_01470 [Rhizomicrobium sp.]|nr:hypothetical protein [Rhizomicrobium sp.]